MSKRLVLLMVLLLSLGIVLVGCGSSEETTKEEKSKSASTEKKEKEEKVDEDKEDKDESSSSKVDFSKLIKEIENRTEGTTKVLFESSEQQTYETEGISVSLDAYTLVELKDFHTDYSIPFGDKTDGAVLLASYTITNGTDKDVYYMPSFYIEYPGTPRHYSNYRDLTPEEGQVQAKLNHSNDYELKAGETVVGYEAYPFGEEVLDHILGLETVAIPVSTAQAKKGEFSNPIGEKGKFVVSLTEEGSKKASAAAKFYEDRASFDNMGEKEMLKEKADIGKKEKLGEAEITFEGYQFTKFTPNEVEAPRFKNYKNGIVLLTAKFQIENKGSETISTTPLSGKLTMNDGSSYTLSEGLLEPMDNGTKKVNKDESAEVLKVFTIDEEQYEKILKDKSFEIEIGPLYNDETKDISKGKRVTFELPK